MNAQMWENPITQQQPWRRSSKSCAYQTVGPDEGWQACRTS